MLFNAVGICVTSRVSRRLSLAVFMSFVVAGGALVPLFDKSVMGVATASLIMASGRTICRSLSLGKRQHMVKLMLAVSSCVATMWALMTMFADFDLLSYVFFVWNVVWLLPIMAAKIMDSRTLVSVDTADKAFILNIK